MSTAQLHVRRIVEFIEQSYSQPVTLRVLDGSDGLDGLPGFTPRPPGVGIAGSHTSEMAVVGRTVTL